MEYVTMVVKGLVFAVAILGGLVQGVTSVQRHLQVTVPRASEVGMGRIAIGAIPVILAQPVISVRLIG